MGAAKYKHRTCVWPRNRETCLSHELITASRSPTPTPPKKKEPGLSGKRSPMHRNKRKPSSLAHLYLYNSYPAKDAQSSVTSHTRTLPSDLCAGPGGDFPHCPGVPMTTSLQFVNKECSGPITRSPSVVIAPYQSHRMTVGPEGMSGGIWSIDFANVLSRQCAKWGVQVSLLAPGLVQRS